MNKYAAVWFYQEETKEYRDFLKMMNGVHIITLSKEAINRCVDEELANTPGGATIRLVLHNEEEVETFKNCMQAFLPNKKYELTNTPNDASFERWLKEKETIRI